MIFVAPFAPAVKAVADAIAAIADWWGEGGGNLHLMKNNPAIDSNTIIATFTEADFPNYAPLAAGDAPNVWYDPLTGNITMIFPQSEGPYFWATGAMVSGPQTIYGAYLTNGADDKLLGAVKFSEPIILTAQNQYVEIGSIRLVVNMTLLGG